eukprot:5300091-Amphidinium_carterae.1
MLVASPAKFLRLGAGHIKALAAAENGTRTRECPTPSLRVDVLFVVSMGQSARCSSSDRMDDEEATQKCDRALSETSNVQAQTLLGREGKIRRLNSFGSFRSTVLNVMMGHGEHTAELVDK